MAIPSSILIDQRLVGPVVGPCSIGAGAQARCHQLGPVHESRDLSSLLRPDYTPRESTIFVTLYEQIHQVGDIIFVGLRRCVGVDDLIFVKVGLLLDIALDPRLYAGPLNVRQLRNRLAVELLGIKII